MPSVGPRQEPRVSGPQGAGAALPNQEGQQAYLMDTCIAFRATDLEHAKRVATEIAAEIRESDRVVLCHVAMVELDESYL